MNLFVSVTYYYPHVSGLTAHAQMIAEALAAGGHEVSVLCHRHESRLSPTSHSHRVHIYRAHPLFRFSKGFLSLHWFWLMMRLVRECQAVILHLPQPEAIFPALLARLLGKRVVVFYHCDVVLPSSLSARLISLCLRLSHFLTLNLAHTIIHSTSDYAAHSSLLQSFSSKLVFTYPPIKTYPLSKSSRPHSEKLIGFVGRLAADKGVEILLQTIPILKQKLSGPFKILLAGPYHSVGEKSYAQTLNRLINQYSQLIHHIGPLSDTDLAAFYQRLDVLVLPSVNATESFGTVQVEAMLAGTPVVASDLPGVRVPVQRTGLGLLVPPHDPVALAQAIVKVLAHHESFTHSRVDLSKEFNFNQTLAVYQHSLGIT